MQVKKQKTRRGNNEVDFWQSSTDLLLAFSLILLLIIALLLLALFHLPEEEGFSLWGTEANVQELDREDAQRDDGEEDRDDDNDDDDGGGGGDGDGPYEENEFDEQYPLPAASGGEGDDWGKSAVYVTVIDAESGRAIREAGITFELYEQSDSGDPADETQLNGAIRYLNTYYPKKIEYRNYETTGSGVFYLPEKIETGWYYFKEITEPEGYDAAGAVRFELDDVYDWPDPYVVSVALSPSKNLIRVKLTDAGTGEPVSGGTFQITAAQDISTADGTVRYRQGNLADTISTGEDGLGESQELYLGHYTVSQSAAPKYYTTVEDVVEVEVEKKNGLEIQPLEFQCEKTAIRIRLTDDLAPNLSIADASFLLTADGVATQRGQTDENGELVFTDLEKNVTYHLRQESAPGDYSADEGEYTFPVDRTGHIDGQASVSVALTNYVPRVAIRLTDIILRTPVSGQKITLYDSQGQQIHTYTASGTDEIFTDLAEGSYYILVNERESSRMDFLVEDAGAVNTVSFTVWTLQSVLTLAAAAVLVSLAAWLAVRLLRRHGRRRKKKAKEGMS